MMAHPLALQLGNLQTLVELGLTERRPETSFGGGQRGVDRREPAPALLLLDNHFVTLRRDWPLGFGMDARFWQDY
jgi:hypothetical protein